MLCFKTITVKSLPPEVACTLSKESHIVDQLKSSETYLQNSQAAMPFYLRILSP